MESNTAKNFALQLGSLVALYVSLSAITALLFGVININFPDELTNYWQYESAQQGIRFGIAMLIVFFPTYLVLTRLVNNTRRKEHGTYLTLTKWLIYLSLLVGGAVLLGDLVAVINAFLNGEITQRFILKALAILVIVGAAFYYYLLDARGYWTENEKHSKLFALAVTGLVLLSLVYGYMAIDTPAQVRELRLDQQQIGDLQDLQWRIEDFYRTNQALPEGVAELYVGRDVASSAEGRSDYSYVVTGEKSYELCAEFSADVENTLVEQPRYIGDVKNPLNNNWDYQEGETCFKRVISDIPTN